MKKLVILAVLLLSGGTALAYPQFQLVRDQTCTGCHISPAGGGLLNENGLLVAESISQFGTKPEFIFGKVPSPDWLQLSGDLRGAAGYLQTPEKAIAIFPMQAELNVRATFDHFSVNITGGARPAQTGFENTTRVWSREHYLMYRQNLDENTGLYVRAGRMMPVYGLRLAEHPTYTRRFGGTQLYSETYGASVSYVQTEFELHASGFLEDPVIDPVEHANGGALYGEYRLSEKLSIGAEGMAKITDADKKFYGGITGKAVVGPEVLLQLEVQFINQLINNDRAGAGTGAPKQLVGYLLASKALGENGQFLVDVGLGHFDENIRIKNLDRDCVDLNLHWFTASHLELILNTRFEMIAFGAGGQNGAYALLQAHIRL